MQLPGFPGGLGGMATGLPGGLQGLQGLPNAGLPSLAPGLPGFPGLPRPALGGIPGHANFQALAASLGGGGLGPGTLGLGSTGLIAGGVPGAGGLLGTAGLGVGLHGTGAPNLAGLLRPPQQPTIVRPGTVPGLGAAPMISIASSTSKASSPVVPKQGGQVLLAPPIATVAAPCTVYVGRISTEVPDEIVKQLMEKCGKVSKWNRAADPNTSKLTSFGFCDFEDPQGVWRAMKFLHEKQLCDKRLLVKCEEKAKQTIDKWKDSRREELAKKRAEEVGQEEKKDGEQKEGDEASKNKVPEPLTDEQLEEALFEESKDVGEEIAKILAEKNKGYPDVRGENAVDDKDVSKAGEKDAKVEDGKAKASDDKVDKDSKDTDKDRDEADKDNGKDKDKDKDKEKDRDKDKSAGDKKEDSSNDRGKENNNSNKRDRSREGRDRDEKRSRRDDDKKSAVSRHYRQSRRERDREQRVRDRDRDIDKEYQYRIREFERGEDHRIKALKRDLRDLEIPPEPSEREKRKCVERDLNFGKSESEEREWKRHREDRRHERQREKEKDEADRAAEQKEIEEERRKKEEEERRKRKEIEEAKRKAKLEAEEEKRRQREEERKRKEEEMKREQEELRRQQEEERKKREAEQKKVQEAAAAKLLQSVQEEMRNTAASAARNPQPTGQNATSQAAKDAFRDQGDTDAQGLPRKHKPLTRLEGPLRDDEMRRLILQVPTDKSKAFAYDIDWQIVHDHNIIEKKLRPWVKKKVTEYLGTEEQGMIDFIMRKVASHTSPDTILAELEGFLDEEAENFTLKMWRMIIFEVLRVRAR